jgi:peptidoglycan hydrolase CwlO-like protein
MDNNTINNKILELTNTMNAKDELIYKKETEMGKLETEIDALEMESQDLWDEIKVLQKRMGV